ncbi:hypothetical protein HMI54_010253 [Coelomomyces lativittatus]|nr:hypothetical protein HMI54_010253 [Coelomomyces lativittatus]
MRRPIDFAQRCSRLQASALTPTLAPWIAFHGTTSLLSHCPKSAGDASLAPTPYWEQTLQAQKI